MRVAFVTFEYPPFVIGGAGVYAAHVTEELANLGHQVIVFTPAIGNTDSTEHPPSANLQVWHVPVCEAIPFNALQFWINLPREIKKAESEQKFDIIHINGISYWFLKRKLSIAPHVLTVHHLVRDAATNTNLSFYSRMKNVSGENGFVIPLIERRSLYSVDRIVAVSNYTKDRILQTYNISSAKIDVIYNGVESSKHIFKQEDLDQTRKDLKLPDCPIILFVGRVDDPRKGLDILIKAFREVIRDTNATLLIVGQGDHTKAQKLAKPFLKNIVMLGYVDESILKKCYALCDIYVCPSRLEGFGLTLLEALTAGKPIIATRTGAIPEVLGEQGILVEPNDVDALSYTIRDVLKNCENRCNSPKSAVTTLEKFSWKSSANALNKLYQECIGEFKII